MATAEQIEQILSAMPKHHPHDFFRQSEAVRNGTGGALVFLDKSTGEVSAGEISEALHISTARTAVLLGGMEKKGLIIKCRSTHDARVTVVTLSEKGKGTVDKMRENMRNAVGKLIDELGMKRMTEFTQTLNEIQQILLASICKEI